jgi:hypothetical protein
VGVPQRNSLDEVTDEATTVACATAANKAAYLVLSKPPPHFAADDCIQFRRVMKDRYKLPFQAAG